ncbi:MAG: glycosyltransferase family 39 protein [Chloroflexota bacterium]|nr:glycosyltransferase family 39 protein [Chloroflexota bacterium]
MDSFQSPVSDADNASLPAADAAEAAAPRASRFRQARWLLAIIGLAAFTGYILWLAPSRSPLWWVALALVALLVVVTDAGISPLQLPRVMVRGVRSWLQDARSAGSDAVHRQRVVMRTSIAALILMVIGAPLFANRVSEGDLSTAVVLMLIGAVALGMATLVGQSGVQRLFAAGQTMDATGGRVLWAAAGVVLMFVVAELSANTPRSAWIDAISIHVQFVLFVGGIALMGIGLSGQRLALPRMERFELGAVLLITLLALALRVWGLNDTLRYSVDEGVAVQGILNIFWDSDNGLVSAPSSYISTYLFPYLQWWASTLGGPSLVTARLMSAVLGALTVVGVYLLVRTLFDVRTALVAAVVLATFPPHIHFSRLALSHIGDAAVGAFLLAFYVRALKDNRRADWVLTGIVLGLSQYFFESGRLFYPLFMVACVVGGTVLAPRRMSERWRGVALMVITGLFVALPMQYVLYISNAPFGVRFGVSGLGADYWSNLFANGLTMDVIGQLLTRFLLPFQTYVRLPENDIFYGGSTAMILVVAVPFFLLGCFYLLWRLNPLTLPVVLWIALVAMGNGLLRDSLVYARYVLVFPGLAIAVGIGINRVLTDALPLRRVWIAVVVLTVGLGAWQTAYYFNDHMPALNQQFALREPPGNSLDGVLRAAQLPPNTDVFVIGNPLPDLNVMRVWMAYLRGGSNDVRVHHLLPADVNDAFFASLPQNSRLAFLVSELDNATNAILPARLTLGEAQHSLYNVAPEYLLYVGEG